MAAPVNLGLACGGNMAELFVRPIPTNERCAFGNNLLLFFGLVIREKGSNSILHVVVLVVVVVR